MQVEKARPPYVVFEREERERRAADGSPHPEGPLSIDVAYVTPVGSKDRIPRIVSDWFPSLQDQVMQGRFEQQWLDAYKAAYEAWKRDEEPPINGFSVKNWPVLTKAQIKHLLSFHVITVEDLAAANEETLNRIGMGSRALKTSAVAFLQAQSDPNQFASRFAAMEVKLGEVLERNTALEEANVLLKNQLTALTVET